MNNKYAVYKDGNKIVLARIIKVYEQEELNDALKLALALAQNEITEKEIDNNT